MSASAAFAPSPAAGRFLRNKGPPHTHTPPGSAKASQGSIAVVADYCQSKRAQPFHRGFGVVYQPAPRVFSSWRHGEALLPSGPQLGIKVVQTPRVAFHTQQSMQPTGLPGTVPGVWAGRPAALLPCHRGQAALHFPQPLVFQKLSNSLNIYWLPY